MSTNHQDNAWDKLFTCFRRHEKKNNLVCYGFLSISQKDVVLESTLLKCGRRDGLVVSQLDP